MDLRGDGTMRFLPRKTGCMVMPFTETENNRFAATIVVDILQDRSMSVFYILVLDVFKLSE